MSVAAIAAVAVAPSPLPSAIVTGVAAGVGTVAAAGRVQMPQASLPIHSLGRPGRAHQFGTVQQQHAHDAGVAGSSSPPPCCAVPSSHDLSET